MKTLSRVLFLLALSGCAYVPRGSITVPGVPMEKRTPAMLLGREPMPYEDVLVAPGDPVSVIHPEGTYSVIRSVGILDDGTLWLSGDWRLVQGWDVFATKMVQNWQTPPAFWIGRVGQRGLLTQTVSD